MEFRKNDLVTLEIEDCGIDGEGIKTDLDIILSKKSMNLLFLVR